MARLKRCKSCIHQHGKCDGKRPICDRCKVTGQVCIWPIKEEGPVFFCYENEHANGEIRRPRGPPRRHQQTTVIISRPTSTAHKPAAHSCSGHQRSQSLSPDHRAPDVPSIRAPLHDSLSTYVTHKYAHAFLSQSRGMSSALEGHVSQYGLPESETDASSLSQSAMSAVMLVYFGLTESSQTACTMSARMYEQALHATNFAIQQRSPTPSDDLLLAVMLLGMYEAHLGSRLEFNYLPNALHHYRGALALLSTRGQSDDGSCRSRSLDTVIWRRALRIAVQIGTRTPPAVQAKIRQQDDQDAVIKLIYIRMNELADLSADLQVFMAQPHSAERHNSLKAILDKAVELDVKMTTLSSIISIHDKYYSCSLQPGEQGGKCALKSIMQTYYGCIAYASVHAAHETTVFYGCWLRIKDIILSCIGATKTDGALSFPSSVTELYSQSAKVALEAIIGNILASVPFLLGDLENPAPTVEAICSKANAAHCGQIVFALHSIFTARNTTVQHRRIAQDLLVIVSRPTANGIITMLMERLAIL